MVRNGICGCVWALFIHTAFHFVGRVLNRKRYHIHNVCQCILNVYIYRWIRWMRSYCSLTHCLDLDFVKRKATLDHSDMSVIYNRLGWYRIASEDNEHAGDTRLIQDSQVIRTFAHHYHHPETSPKPARNQPEWVIYLYDTHTEPYSDGWPVIFFICKLIVIDFMCTFCSGQQWRWQG